MSAYDPFKQEVSWTASESAFGQAVSLFTMHSAPDGGVLAVVGRTKIVAGAPTTERTHALVKIGPTGLKMWDKDLPNRDGDSATFVNARVTIDAGGRAVITRNASLRTSNGNWRHGISIEVLSPSGAHLYQKIMHGNLDATSGELTGYIFGSGGYSQPTIGLNTLFLRAAKCKGSDCSIPVEAKLYPIAIPGLGMDYPRSHVITRSQRVPAAYIALGDSFSSGEGVEPFQAWTNLNHVNECHRSEYAYAKIIAGSSPHIPNLSPGSFRACSGAQTHHVEYASQWNEDAQLDLWQDTSTRLVTLTIGGNDLGFSSVIETCAWPLADCAGAFHAGNQKINELGERLISLYTKILMKAPNAQVVVLGYPPMFANGPGCALGPNSDYPIYTESRKQKAIELLYALNAKISSSVETVRGLSQSNFNRLKFIDATSPGSPFINHDICSTEPYFHGLNLLNRHFSFHPNIKGHHAYAQLITNALK